MQANLFITDIKQNASVSKDRNKLTETNTIEEIENKDQEKKGKYNNIMGWINKANKNMEESEDAKVEPLIPENENENENENLIDTSNNNNNINNDGTLNTKGMKMKGPTKLRGRKKSEKNESGATVLRTRPKVDFTKKKGYDEEIGIREKYQKERICIDEDRLFLKRGN